MADTVDCSIHVHVCVQNILGIYTFHKMCYITYRKLGNLWMHYTIWKFQECTLPVYTWCSVSVCCVVQEELLSWLAYHKRKWKLQMASRQRKKHLQQDIGWRGMEGGRADLPVSHDLTGFLQQQTRALVELHWQIIQVSVCVCVCGIDWTMNEVWPVPVSSLARLSRTIHMIHWTILKGRASFSPLWWFNTIPLLMLSLFNAIPTIFHSILAHFTHEVSSS